jgi:uncharacterized membrane protein YoaK (UPF0700 family)
MSAPTGTGKHAGLLIKILLLLTTVTGIVDAISYLSLGRVFVANMTGNVVFLAFAISGDKQLSIAASFAALAAFMVGAVGGGRLGVRLGAHRGKLLAAGIAVTTLCVAAALVVSLFPTRPLSAGPRYWLIVLLALGMGVQNAAVRRLGVADATTTVLTMTITGLAADSVLAGGPHPRPWRRIGSIVTMFAGALAGALLIRESDLRGALSLALAVLLAAAWFVRLRASRSPADAWESSK